MSTKKISQQGKVPTAQASARTSNASVPKAQPLRQIDEPPQWATQLITGIENLNSRVGLIESGAMRPSFSEAASDVSDGGAVLVPPGPNVGSPASDWQQVVRPKVRMGPPAPRMGESGSGYTLLPNGKMVRNKRPAHKPLSVRQAINWRSKATTELVSFLKERGIGKSDPKPILDSGYTTLVEDLAKAKAYYAYAKNGGTQQVHVWREANKDITMSLPEGDSQSWADEMSEVASQTAVEQTTHDTPTPGQVPADEAVASGSMSQQTLSKGKFPFVPPQVEQPVKTTGRAQPVNQNSDPGGIASNADIKRRLSDIIAKHN